MVNVGGEGFAIERAQVGIGLGDVEGRDAVSCRDGRSNVDVGDAIDLEEFEVWSRFDVDPVPPES